MLQVWYNATNLTNRPVTTADIASPSHYSTFVAYCCANRLFAQHSAMIAFCGVSRSMPQWKGRSAVNPQDSTCLGSKCHSRARLIQVPSNPLRPHARRGPHHRGERRAI